MTTILSLVFVWPLLAQVPPPPPPPPPPPQVSGPARDAAAEATGTAMLAGTIVADDGSGRPLRRATVTARSSALSSGSRLLMSDAEGQFAFTSLPAGTYSLAVSKPGWVNGYYGASESWKGPGTPVVLAEGEERTDIDVRLAPGAAITGRIYSQFGQPQAGARVLALERRRYGGEDQLSPARSSSGLSQTTDDRGEFRLYGLPPGEFVIGASTRISAQGETVLTTPEELRWAEQVSRSGLSAAGTPPPPGPAVGASPVYYPGTMDPAGATLVSVGAGEERTGVDFQLQFVPTAAVRGTLTMPDGRPAQGVTLVMASASSSLISSLLLVGSPLNRANLGRDGSFAFESITPGEYFLTAQASSQPPAARGRGRGRAAGPGGPRAMDLWASANVTVNGRDVEGLALQLQPGVTISGRLAFSGTDLEPPEDLAGVSLRLRAAANAALSVGAAPAEANADGTFVLTGVTPGRYVLSVSAPRGRTPDAPAWFAHRADVDGVNAVELPFEVVPGRDINDVVVEFTDQPAELSGQVTDADGRPVAGLTMVLFRADPAIWALPAIVSSRRTSRLDSEGRYRLSPMAPGDYFLAALGEIDQADLADPAFLEEVAASAIRVTLTLGEKTVQDIQLGGG